MRKNHLNSPKHITLASLIFFSCLTAQDQDLEMCLNGQRVMGGGIGPLEKVLLIFGKHRFKRKKSE